MTVDLFRDDDAGFITWCAAHPTGYVLNVQRGLNPGDARVHTTRCPHLARAIDAARTGRSSVTSAYVKVCALNLADLDAWTRARIGPPARRCPRCQPAPTSDEGPRNVGPVRRRGRAAHDTHRSRAAAAPLASESRKAPPPYLLLLGAREVRMEGPRYLPFQGLDVEQHRARSALQAQLHLLRAGPGELLHAWFSGPRPRNSDVENIVLYNIDSTGACFRSSCLHGVRFETTAGKPAPGTPCVYQYRVAPAAESPRSWRTGVQLARFHNIDLGRFAAQHRLAQVWWAVHHGPAEIATSPLSPDASFGVFLEFEAPASVSPGVPPELVKSLVDGVICAFQNHLDQTTVANVAARIAPSVAVSADLVATQLASEHRAVLGAKTRLVHARGGGVQWSPDDHRCVLGQVLRRPGDSWRVSGELHAVEPNN